MLDVSAKLLVLLCMDRAAEARTALIAALADEDDREDALRWVQPFADPAVQSDFRRNINQRIRLLQRDPAVTTAVARYGRILDWTLTAAVPVSTDLPLGSAGATWRCDDQN